MKPAHRRGNYHVNSRRTRQAANNNPNTTCQSPVCKGWGNRTLTEHPDTTTGHPPQWQAGHLNPGEPGGQLQPEVNVCNTSEGNALKHGNRRTEPHTERW
jgi:hypothetical protein